MSINTLLSNTVILEALAAAIQEQAGGIGEINVALPLTQSSPSTGVVDIALPHYRWHLGGW